MSATAGLHNQRSKYNMFAKLWEENRVQIVQLQGECQNKMSNWLTLVSRPLSSLLERWIRLTIWERGLCKDISSMPYAYRPTSAKLLWHNGCDFCIQDVWAAGQMPKLTVLLSSWKWHLPASFRFKLQNTLEKFLDSRAHPFTQAQWAFCVVENAEDW